MRNLLVAVAVACGVLFTLSTPAEADFKIRLSTNGGTTFGAPVGDGDLLDISGTAGKIAIAVASLTVEASTTSFISTALTLMDLAMSGNAAALTPFDIVVQASLTNINTAPPPQILNYFFTGSVTPPVLTATMQSWVDDANGLFGTAAIVADTGDYNVPPGTALLVGDSKVFSANDPYSLTVEITLKGTTGASPNSISLDNNNMISPAVPAPGGLVLALAAIPIIGIGAFLRRRSKLAVV